MNTENENDITLVERYFDQDLSDLEVNAFNQRLEKDGSFKAMFDREKTLIRSIRYEGLQRDLQVLKQIEMSARQDSTRQTGIWLKSWYFKIAASIVILLVAIKLLVPVHEDSEKLFQAYFKPYPNVFEPTVRGNDDVTQRSEIFLAYERGNYQEALNGFNEILKNGNEPGVLLLAGNANLMLGNIQEAKNNFLILIKNYDELDTQAKWFLSLCYLKEGDVDQARMMLEELGGTEISYANKAKELLKKVD
ncbi:MAG TPA: tetratricopeptide repeat protein [Cyclobacteriaceae bacterium]|nr:tetratricopeptide repeat protein [Cyclobacteriaceae bacterium]